MRRLMQDRPRMISGILSYAAAAHGDREIVSRLTDRAEDVIKSGGEWIGSIDIENIAVDRPGVRFAGVIGVPHP